jgi:hypothetical protein
MNTETPSANRIHDLRTLEQKLEQVRDELRLRIHLARADARDEFDRQEVKLQRFRSRLGALRGVTEEVREDVWEGLHNIGLEIADGFDRIRRIV